MKTCQRKIHPNRILSLLLSLVFVLSLLPTTAAAADGDHTHEWHSSWTADETHHWHACTGSGTCDADDTAAERAYGAHDWDSTYTYRCNTCYYRTEHTCTGGEATCKYQATCELCGVGYGDTNPDNHQSRVADWIDEASHKVYCPGCDHVYVESESHTFDNWEDNGDGTQSRGCSVCYYYETHTHSYTAATCTTPATCSCGATTGGVDSTNHTGDTEVRNQKDATEFEDGYTGDTYCLGCNTMIEQGEVIGATHTHSYTQATDGDNHWDVCSCGDKKDEAAHEWTYTYDDDEMHTMACTVCEYEAGGSHFGIINTMVDDDYHWWNLPCCGNEKNKGSHTYDNAYATQCNATFDIIRCTYDRSQSCTHSWGNYSNKNDVHEKTCSKCGLTVSENHFANTYNAIAENDTINAAAHTEVCACGKSWEAAHELIQTNPNVHTTKCTLCIFSSDNHVYTVFKPSEANPETYHVAYCFMCGEMSDPVQVAGHKYGGRGYGPAEHWDQCTDCGHTTGKTAHQMTAAPNDGDDATHIVYCDGCEYAKYENCVFDAYDGDEDYHWTVCSACGDTPSRIGMQAHADGNSDGKCDVCGVSFGQSTPTGGGSDDDDDDDYTPPTTPPTTPSTGRSEDGISTQITAEDGSVFGVSFIPGDGVTLPDDAELVVEDHYPSLAPIASTVVPTAETEYVDIPENNISRLEDKAHAYMNAGYMLGEIVVIDGEKYIVCGGYVAHDFGNVVYLIRLSDNAKFAYYVQGSTLVPGSTSYDVEIQTNRTIVINGAKYDVPATITHNGIEQYAVLYVDGVQAGLYIPSNNEASFYEGYDPETLKAQQDDNDLGSVTIPADYNNAAIADLAPGKTYKVSVIGANDISVEGLTEVNGTVTQTFKIPDALVGAKNVKYVAVHDTNPYAAELAEAERVMKSYEPGSADYSQAMNDYILVKHRYDAWEKENGSGTQFGELSISQDGKIVTVTYAAVDSFSPFIVYAFVEADEPEYKVIGSPFADVSTGAWYYDAVKYVYDNGLMNGVGGNRFAPGSTTSRAMIWTILARLDGVDASGEVWYQAGQKWAVENGISDGTMANDPITREQLATILWRYAKYKGMDVSVGEDTNILSYNDAFDISDYAFAPLQWACGEGIVGGKPGGLLDPRGSATRAEAAAMLMRFGQ